MDIVNKQTRSRMMSGIKGKDTQPELLIRRMLHKDGFRFRIHVKHLPGKPDIVLRKYNAVIFIHGCFWHMHDCKYFKWPKSRMDFWRNKLTRNHFNDMINMGKLFGTGWRICIIWECSIRDKANDIGELKSRIVKWLTHGNDFLEVP